MERLLRKFETAKSYVPAPILHEGSPKSRYGVIYFGSTAPAMDEALDRLAANGSPIDAMRVRAFPFADSVAAFIASHEKVFVVEQNRDGQLRSMLCNEIGVDPARLIAVLHYDGTPITARFIIASILSHQGLSDISERTLVLS